MLPGCPGICAPAAAPFPPGVTDKRKCNFLTGLWTFVTVETHRTFLYSSVDAENKGREIPFKNLLSRIVTHKVLLGELLQLAPLTVTTALALNGHTRTIAFTTAAGKEFVNCNASNE